MSRIGQYEIESEIGRGAMGAVYLAYDPRVRRRVAIKTFTVPTSQSPDQASEQRERFLREARAAGGLSHPGIVTIHEIDEDPALDFPFIVMEYVEGQTLQDLIRSEGPLEPERVQRMAATLTGALHAAHQVGIVHRDIKPANILVRAADGAVKIADFGVAKISSSDLTQSGNSVGSPSYMSPEQLRGETADSRSDLFSLAVVLYQALCDERPFAGSDLASLTYSVVHEDPTPITVRCPSLPLDLDRFFERALAKDPSKRFQNGTEFCEALCAACPDRPVGETREARAIEVVSSTGSSSGRERNPRRRLLLAAASMLVVSLGAWGILSWALRESPVAPASEARATSPESQVNSSRVPESPPAEPVMPGDAQLTLVAHSSVKEGTLILLVDGKAAYTRPLSTGGGKTTRLYRRATGQLRETFEARVTIPAGEHLITARVTAEDRNSPFEDTVLVDLEPGETRTLLLRAGKLLGRRVSLRLD